MSLEIFFLCVKIIKIKRINKINFISSPKLTFGEIIFKALSFTEVTTKTVNEENIDDKDEYLEITPDSVRLRKKYLKESDRTKSRR